MAAHCSIGGSTAARTIQCPAWINFCKDIPRKSSKYADEGTAAHALLEKVIKSRANVWDVSHVAIGDGKMWDVDSDMRRCVNDAEKLIRGIADDMHAPVQSEVQFDLSSLLPDDLAEFRGHIGGTADVVIEAPFESLVVLDYKHGAGVGVKATGNAQMRFYAMGALSRSTVDPTDVMMGIIQPRTSEGPTYSQEVITVAELKAWWTETFVPALRKVKAGTEFGTGQYCKFCPGAATCPAMAKQAIASAQLEFQSDGQLPAKAAVTLPAPADMAVEHLRRAMDLADILGEWMKAVKDEVEERLVSGAATPETIGWKRVEGRKSRKWKDAEQAARALELLGSDVFEPRTLKTVAQVEKVIKSENGNLAALEGLVDVSYSVSLVPAADKRPALSNQTAADVFTKVEI